ncbi:putative ring zinc finger protein [Rosellinia necatrix]|uniref:E3 ubiquitin-protein ligase listerin n=1 Tax=Rosellinia necatrix TaxID=77044 RepID=A0A1W2TE31_ROSNE|nr:putative ring zinc finger protein [Rosellinia necatrix]
MSRKPGKARAASSKAVSSFGTSFGTSSFGSFTPTATASGINLSYLAEPPDLASVSDANVVVSLKNLQKKDATTKAKALEELLTHAQAHRYEQDGGAEEPVLEAWVQSYPRISIDNSRRVRELSHIVQFELMKSARKRMERNVPKIVGPWLAGTFDRDKAVSRAASEGLSSFLTTPEKISQFWKRCQQQILHYANDAIKETPGTLSDRRSTNADDADAKYFRVLAGGLALVLSLLQKLNTADMEKCIDAYDEVFENDKVWTSAILNDTNVRRLSSQLLLVCIEKRPDRVEADLSRISKVFIAEALQSSQIGSATDYINALTKATAKYPMVWTSEYRGKKSPVSRLRIFLESGSQGGPPHFWTKLTQLIESIPSEILPQDVDGAIDFLKSMRKGITSRDEPRSNAVEAWSAYLSLARHFLQSTSSTEARIRLCQGTVFPLIKHYLFPSPETSIWSSGSQLQILIRAYTSTTTPPFEDLVEPTKLEWGRLKDELNDHIRNSLPEASKEHHKSQKSVAEEGNRWFSLTGKILDAHRKTTASDRPIPDIPAQLSLELLGDSLKILQTRKWKPFGVAQVVEFAFKLAPSLFATASSIQSVLDGLNSSLVEGREEFLRSASAPFILSSIIILGKIPQLQNEFERLWKASISVVLECLDAAEAIPALSTLVSSNQAAIIAQQNSTLQTELIRRCLMCAVGNSRSSWDLLNNVFTVGALSEPTSKRLIQELTNHMTNPVGEPNEGVLRALRIVAEKKLELLTQDEEAYMALMTSLLGISEKGCSPEVDMLHALLKDPSSGTSNAHILIEQNLNSASLGSLSIETIAQQALQAQEARQKSPQDVNVDSGLFDFLPNTTLWRQQLCILFQQAPDPSLSLTNSLGGACFLAGCESTSRGMHTQRDGRGCSIPGRMAMYMTKLMAFGFDFDHTEFSIKIDLIINLCLTVELAADQLTTLGEGGIWGSLSSHDTLSDLETLVTTTRKFINEMVELAENWLDGTGTEQSRLVHAIIGKLARESCTLSPLGFYSARAMQNILQALTERHGFPSSGEKWLTDTDSLKGSASTMFAAAATLSGLGETVSTSRSVKNFCNRLVSDIAGAKSGEEKSLIKLILLDQCTQIYDVGELPVANIRLVSAVRQITSWLSMPEDIGIEYATEICRCLQRLLPCIKDVYGSHWEDTVHFCLNIWTKPPAQPFDARIPEIHASLRLMATLQSLEEPSDDLVDVLEASAERRSTALIDLLKLPREKHTQPLDILDSLICRQVEKVPLEYYDDLSELYALVASESRAIQTAAFTMLNKALPAVQEKLSVDVLLEKRDARLPDELLSLLLEAPTLDMYSDEVMAQFPTPVRSYLLSWHLVFDYFRAASFKVRSDYTENLKTENYVGPLMDFAFDVLGHSAAHGLNLDQVGLAKTIQHYDPKLAESESEERNMQWLLVHIYYLVLKFVPGLFKTWYISCRSKQTRIAVEAWMTRFFSPTIIKESLDDVTKWKDSQEGDEKELSVKVSPKTKEVIAGYEVDDLTASIAIRIPPEFPLEAVTVVGINRVAVDERKWKSWIMTTQGVITFSGGNIIDGLVTFRRNVFGALKGQTECAICYSIISTDKKMPDKRCQTCKNLFHRTCLYKWFQSSNQNTCPLCRNPIDYLGADTRARRAGA